MSIPALPAAGAPQAATGAPRGPADERRHQASFSDLLATHAEDRAALAGQVSRAGDAGASAEPGRAGPPGDGAEAETGTGQSDMAALARSIVAWAAETAFPPDGGTMPAGMPAAARPVARMFNEYGFFGPPVVRQRAAGATPAPDSGPAAVPSRPAPAAGGPPPDRSASSVSTPPVGAAAAASAPAATGAGRGLGPPANATGRTGPIAPGPAAGMPASAEPARPAATPPRIAGGRARGEARPASAKPPPARSNDAAANVQLALHAGAAEASLVARVQALTPAEQARLRQEVAALLRRHGYAAVSLRLNGSAGPAGRF